MTTQTQTIAAISAERPKVARALLLDLDDTILDDSSLVQVCWDEACLAHADRFGALEPTVVVDAIRGTSKWFWDDPERHRTGRLNLDAARREVVRLALGGLGLDDAELQASIGDAYGRHRDARMEPIPDAIETVRWLRGTGRRLALLTNGAGDAQRKKIARFALGDLFDTILVEGEVGFGKPDLRIYRHALEVLGVDAADAWMVGDNLEWDVVAPQSLGLTGVWVNATGREIPHTIGSQPTYVIKALSDLRALPPLR